VALVTGASAGIGASVATSLLKAGMRVVGCARREDRIEELAKQLQGEKGKLYSRRCDLQDERDIRSMFDWIEGNSDLGRIDICINNAGLSSRGSLMEGTMSDWRRMLDVNVLALCLCTQLSIKSMVRHGVDDGQIVMVSSFSGHRLTPNPDTRFYASTKFAVTALLEGWRQEVRELGGNIRVAGISPGLVDTEFAQSMYPDQPEKAAAVFTQIKCLEAQDMADTVLHIISAPKHVQIHDVLVRPTQQKT